ncbi:hypothetical protein AYO40_06585 [Planctomycetaceae bacterium SCGC AG-212-D15]|nr:hypothetical protein AYO40_06585 [Planctomycetaceae bacterium SCGC AG-212-D15]
MPYVAEISRTNPSCFLFLVDQSGSMTKPSVRRRAQMPANELSEAPSATANRPASAFAAKASSYSSALLPRLGRWKAFQRSGPD